METQINPAEAGHIPASPYFADSKLRQVLQDLEDPFDVSLVQWKPQATSKDRSRAMVAAYADPRAYIDRLNLVVGVTGWTQQYELSTLSNFVMTGGYGDNKTQTPAGKVLARCKVTIFGLGVKEDVGESWADDDNAVTIASAQAFKRACTQFGLGRYFYDLPKGVWVAYDDKAKRVTEPPQLPAWAYPSLPCEGAPCRGTGRIRYWSQNSTEFSPQALAARSQKQYAAHLCVECQIARAREVQAAAGKAIS